MSIDSGWKMRLGICSLVAGLMLTGAWCASLPAANPENESQTRLQNDARYLASDDLEGRGVGTKGLGLAAEYIRDEFAKAGLDVTQVKGGAFQPFPLTTGSKLQDPNSLNIRNKKGESTALKLGTDYTPLSFGGAGPLEAGLVFVGYGIEAADAKFDEYAGLDVKGKIVIVVRKNPQQSRADGAFAVAGHKGGISRHADLQTKVSTAFSKGAAGVLFLNDLYSLKEDVKSRELQMQKSAVGVAESANLIDTLPPEQTDQIAAAKANLTNALKKFREKKEEFAQGEIDTLMKFGYGGDEASRSIPVLHVKRSFIDALLQQAGAPSLADWEAAVDGDLKPRSLVLTDCTAQGTVTIDREQTEVKNVIAVLPGTGPLAEETIVIGAHYDHVGRGGKGSLAPGSSDIHNGADDNASGTACLLEVARRLASRKEKLPRRIVFIAFTAEELGLIGSARYVKDPVFPLEKTVAMLNMDMVGRLAGERLTVFGTGTSPVWEPLLQKFSQPLGLQLSFKPEGFGPSDHSSFYGKNIPVLHFFTGNHNDYHRPSDDWEKLNLSGMQRVAELTEQITVELAQTSDRPKYIQIAGTANILGDKARPYFGSIPDYGSDKPGFVLSGVSPGGPADKGGLKGGDRIVQLGMHKVENIQDFDSALRKFVPEETIDVTVLRGTEKVVLKVTLGKPRG